MDIDGSFSAVIAEAFPTNLLGHGSASLESAVDGKTRRPFTRFGAAAIPKSNYSKGYPVVQLLAAGDGTNDLRWNLTLIIDLVQMRPGALDVNHFTVQAMLSQGPRPRGGWKGWGIGGKLELEQTATNIGGTIAGKFRLNTTPFAEE